MKCKITRKKIIPFMSFGKMPIANGFLNKKILKRIFYELKVGFSKNFHYFSCDEYPSIKKMFHKNYPFYTSSSNLWLNILKTMLIGQKIFKFKIKNYWIRLKWWTFEKILKTPVLKQLVLNHQKCEMILQKKRELNQ